MMDYKCTGCKREYLNPSREIKFCTYCGAKCERINWANENEPTISGMKDFIEALKSRFGIELATCPAGSFYMGSSQEERNNINTMLSMAPEETQHYVTLTQEFYIGKYTITQKQYEAIMGNNPSAKKRPNNPVESVSWCKAKEFCHKLNQLTSDIRPANYAFDLPTEAQWEYACRAGTKTSLNNNKNLTSYSRRCPNADEVAWNCYNAEKIEIDGENLETPSEVGLKKPNSWGLYDMHGNVHEWCLDWCCDYSLLSDTDPVNLSPYPTKVLRGGSCRVNPADCRSGSRFCLSPLTEFPDIGFRIALVDAEKATPFQGYPEPGEEDIFWIKRVFTQRL